MLLGLGVVLYCVVSWNSIVVLYHAFMLSCIDHAVIPGSIACQSEKVLEQTAAIPFLSFPETLLILVSRLLCW